MDRKEMLATILLALANCLAISSIATSSWIVNNFAGITRLGLTKMCIQFADENQSYEEEEKCEPLALSSQWATTLVFIVIGICLIFVSVLLLLLSIWKPGIEKNVRAVAFCSMCFFCIGAIIFPFGFNAKEIGGVAYKLPAHTFVGYSYFLFIGSIVILTAGNVLCNINLNLRRIFHR